MRTALLLVLLSCSSDDSSKHELVGCDSWGSGYDTCETACAGGIDPNASTDETCAIDFDPDGAAGPLPADVCPAHLVIDGGCCLPLGAMGDLPRRIAWLECE